MRQVFALYDAGESYQRIAGTLNENHVPFSAEAPLWNKHKVKRLLENPRYTGTDGYPALIDETLFRSVQEKIREKTANGTEQEKRPADRLKPYLRCAACGGKLTGRVGRVYPKDMLCLRCRSCGTDVTIPDAVLLDEIEKQAANDDAGETAEYMPSVEAVRLANAINRALEQPESTDEAIRLILQGASARYDCCPTVDHEKNSLPQTDWKHLGQAVSHITISAENKVTAHWKQRRERTVYGTDNL